jgi:hypothetical protein
VPALQLSANGLKWPQEHCTVKTSADAISYRLNFECPNPLGSRYRRETPGPWAARPQANRPSSGRGKPLATPTTQRRFLRLLAAKLVSVRMFIACAFEGRLVCSAVPQDLLLSEQRLDRSTRVEADSGGNIQILQHIQATIAAFVFRHVGRWLAKPLCHHSLREASSLTLGYQRLA